MEYDLQKWFLCHSGQSIRPCACCQYLRQHIFDHHSSIFSADVALDKHCMTSSQKFWQRTNCLKAIGCSYSQAPLYCANLYVPCLPFLDLQLTLTWNKLLYHNPLCFLPPFFCPWPWGHSSSVRAGQALKSLYYCPSSTCHKLDSSCLSIQQRCSVNFN